MIADDSLGQYLSEAGMDFSIFLWSDKKELFLNASQELQIKPTSLAYWQATVWNGEVRSAVWHTLFAKITDTYEVPGNPWSKFVLKLVFISENQDKNFNRSSFHL